MGLSQSQRGAPWQRSPVDLENEEKMTERSIDRVRLWHGGAPGRRIGDLILPPDETGLVVTMADQSMAGGFTCIAQRRDRVYATTNREFARTYAGVWLNPITQSFGYGSLYRVEMEDDAEADTDLLSLPGLSFQAPRAKVISVYDAAVKPQPEKFNRLISQILRNHAAAKANISNGSGAP